MASPGVVTSHKLCIGCFIDVRANQSINYLRCRYFFFLNREYSVFPQSNRSSMIPHRMSIRISMGSESLI